MVAARLYYYLFVARPVDKEQWLAGLKQNIDDLHEDDLALDLTVLESEGLGDHELLCDENGVWIDDCENNGWDDWVRFRCVVFSDEC